MGRLSQLIYYLNAEEPPTNEELKTVYTHLDITDELKRYRQEYRRMLKSEKIEDQVRLWD